MSSKKTQRIKPSLAGLETLLAHHGVTLNQQSLEQIWAYHKLIRENNGDGDLTRLRAFETMVERHYADCTLINALIKDWPKRMVDIGSGAGFPGIPLKIVNPQIQLTLCEPRPKRVDFLNMVIDKLKLENIDVFGHKVTSNSLDFPVDGVISRAFENMHKTILRIENSLKVGGKAIFMKGPAAKEELEEPLDPRYEVEIAEFYTIPNSTQERSLIVLKRNT